MVTTIILASTFFSAFAFSGGDVNLDGKVNSNDALMVLKYTVGQKVSINKNYADLNADKKINSSDALAILKTCVGLNKTSKVKIGLILLHDENSTYDKNFLDAFCAACEKNNTDYLIKSNVAEDNSCYLAAKSLVKSGCNVIFADSFGHEDFIIHAAKEYPDVQFCHATGTKAHTEGLENYHNAYASIYEGQYLTGVAAGLKLNEMIKAGKFTANEAKIGYVGSFTYAEVISSYTAFYLGAKSVCSSVKMEVQFTGSWYDETAEKEAATKLIKDGCKLISQYADSYGAPSACEKNGIPNIGYNVSYTDYCPNTSIVSSKINWQPYFDYIISTVKSGNKIAVDWTGTLKDNSVCLTSINNSAAASGTKSKLDEVCKKLKSGELKVFDTSKFTVNGKKITSYKADVNTDAAYEPDTQVISNGIFLESEYRSAPYFDIQIDGITLLNNCF